MFQCLLGSMLGTAQWFPKILKFWSGCYRPRKVPFSTVWSGTCRCQNALPAHTCLPRSERAALQSHQGWSRYEESEDKKEFGWNETAGGMWSLLCAEPAHRLRSDGRLVEQTHQGQLWWPAGTQKTGIEMQSLDPNFEGEGGRATC